MRRRIDVKHAVHLIGSIYEVPYSYRSRHDELGDNTSLALFVGGNIARTFNPRREVSYAITMTVFPNWNIPGESLYDEKVRKRFIHA